MSNDYYNYQKYIDDLTSVLSVGYFYKYNYETIQQRIINSKYFQVINNEILPSEAYLTTNEILSDIYFDSEINELTENIYYRELEWVSTSYINIVKNTSLNFETIFLYAPISEMEVMFKLYHEMDFNKLLKWFNECRNKTSLISIRMKQLKITSNELASECGLSFSMINSLRSRKRDIKKLDVEHALKLAKALNIEVETLLNN
ncbi:MAG: helix-turn-helix transcriptional regulator [Bacilli bacterium]|nr:helix-turn-helix transcriptional regulator [Bacilli bacterium]